MLSMKNLKNQTKRDIFQVIRSLSEQAIRMSQVLRSLSELSAIRTSPDYG